jgi:hypothetical protein
MTALYEDTAQIPAASRAAVITLDAPTPPSRVVRPVVPDDEPVVDPLLTPPACRSELRAERLRARRVRRFWVGISFLVMGATLGATVTTLELLH